MIYTIITKSNMTISSRKMLKALWKSVEPAFVAQLPEDIKMTDVDISYGWGRITYIAVELNDKFIFFVFDPEEPVVDLFSHHVLPMNLIEQAVLVLNALSVRIRQKSVKAAKSE
jgi:hypothetical protein